MLGRDDDQGRLIEPALFELGDHFADRAVGELDLVQQRRGRGADIVQIATGCADALFDQLLPDTDRLEIHPEDVGNRPPPRAAVVPAADLVEDRLHFQAVVALDVGKAVGPRIAGRDRGLVRQRIARQAGRPFRRQRHRDRVDLGRVVIVDVGPVAGTGDRRVCRVLVRPGSVAAGCVHHAKNRVRAYEIPRIDRSAAMRRIAFEPARIDRRDAAVQAGWRAPV